MITRTTIVRWPFSALLAVLVPATAVSQGGERDSTEPIAAFQDGRRIVPISSYVTIFPFGGRGRRSAITIDPEQVQQLVVRFDRDRIPPGSGPQFVKIVTTISLRDGQEVDQVTQYAFTFPRAETPEEDALQMDDVARQVLQFGFMSRGRSDSVQILVDTIPDWGRIRVEVMPDEEYTKYIDRTDARVMWHYIVRGGLFESKFSLGIPKVLYDTQAADSMDYGNASALLRFHYLDRTTGERFPVSFGFGLYGVSTPIDVSTRGGGFLFSLFFDLVQFLRVNGVEVTDRANAGLELAPFFPVERKTRLIISARIGYIP